MTLILASASPARRTILQNAGLSFDVVPARIDERAAEAPLLEAGMEPEDLALALAMIKAADVSEGRPGDLVIGADQILDLDGERLTKPEDMEAARRQLLSLSGRTHLLHSAVTCAKGGAIVWEHVETVRLTVRRLEPGFVGRYLAQAGADILGSVGAYQLEGRGIQLFEKVEGDYFAVLGLPMLPLLAFLRTEGVVK